MTSILKISFETIQSRDVNMLVELPQGEFDEESIVESVKRLFMGADPLIDGMVLLSSDQGRWRRQISEPLITDKYKKTDGEQGVDNKN